jgi:Spy/CpxP family protein refolding chaperone
MNRLISPAILLAAFTLPAVAQDVPAPHAGVLRLGLSTQQREQVKAILLREKPTLLQLHTALAAERAEMAQQPSFDETATRAIAARYAQANADALVERAKLRSEMLAVLTPAQRQRVAQLRSLLGDWLTQRLQDPSPSL